MGFWEKVKKDIQKGFKEGITVVREKAGELTGEGKRKYKLLDLKSKVHKEMAELGGRVYSSKGKNPILDSKVKTVIAKIKKLETQIEKLEVKPKKTRRKKRVKSKTSQT